MRINFWDEEKKGSLLHHAVLHVSDLGALIDKTGRDYTALDIRLTVEGEEVDVRAFFGHLEKCFSDRDEDIKRAAKEYVETRVGDVMDTLREVETTLKERADLPVYD